MAIRKTSRMRVMTTRWRTDGMSRRARKKAERDGRGAQAEAQGDRARPTPRPRRPGPGRARSSGRSRRPGRSRMPSEIRPWGESVSPRSARILRTTAVLLRETRNP
ncbi:MAG: hypothetical protein M0C28_27420 [Candidatus Moduliflexus flocculans]|nr:hypothetical protein [Candidatus Moduliflexus flocculans]